MKTTKHKVKLAGSFRKVRIGCLFASSMLFTSTSIVNANGVRPGATHSEVKTFNLGSTLPSIPASSLLTDTGSTSIQVGRNPLAVNAKSMLTPAQFVAVMQVIQTGTQTLSIGVNGNATAGSFSIGSALSQYSSLVIPSGVTGRNLRDKSDLVFSGAIINSGRILLSTNNSAMSLSAFSILNMPGALISASGARSNSFSFILNATDSVFNQGIIQSSGSLSISAGSQINNAGSIGSSNALVLNSNSGVVNNSGLLVSRMGDISFTAPTAANLTITNIAGTIQALNGSIYLGNADQSGRNVLVQGGNLQAKTLELVTGLSGTGTLDVNAVVGLLNINACESHVVAATKNLNLGTIILHGDPTFYNTNGDLTLSSSISTNGNPLALIASGNVYAKSAASIDTSSKTGNGGTVTIVAGAMFTSSGAAAGTSDSTSTLSITSSSAQGGYVDLKGNLSSATKGTSITSFNTSSSNNVINQSNGGDVVIIAFSGTGTNSGQVSLPDTLSLKTQGTDTGSSAAKNGNITIIAGSDINIGGATASGATGGGGAVSIFASQPLIASGTVNIKDGAVLGGGSFQPSIPTLGQMGKVTINAPIQASGQVAIQSGSFSSNSITVDNTAVPLGTESILIDTNSSAEIRTGVLSTNGTKNNSNGGIISVYNKGSGGINVSGNISANGIGIGNGGSIALLASLPTDLLTAADKSGPVVLNSSFAVSANGGGGGSGGGIQINGSDIVASGKGAFNLNATGAGAGGGSITVEASKPGSKISVGNTAGTLKFNTQSSFGNGSVKVFSRGGVTVNQSGLLTGAQQSGNGDQLSFGSADGNVLVTGSLSVNGKSGGSGGVISIFSNSSQLFEIGNPIAKNGVWGTLSANGEKDGGAIILANVGTGGMKLDAQSALQVNNGANGLGGTLLLNTSGTATVDQGPGGTLTIPSGVYDVSAKGTGAVGGTLGFYAKDLVITGGASISLASDAPQGKGGVVAVNLDGSGDLSIGATGQITQISASGDSAGAVTVTTAGNLTLQSQTAISVNAGANGSGGLLQLSATNGTGGVLTIPAGTYSADSHGTGLFAGSIIFEGNAIHMTSGTSISLSANSAQGSGGAILVASIGSDDIVVGAGGQITQITANGAIDAGQVAVIAGGSLTLQSQSAISVINGANGSGGSLTLISGNSLTIPGGNYSVNASGKGLYGGSLLFAGKNIILSSGTNITLTADAPQGNGGSVSVVETLAGNSLQVSSKGLIAHISASGGKGDGGRIFLASGGDLYVDGTLLSYSPNGTGQANGGQLTFASGASGLSSKEILSSAWSSMETGVIVGTGTIPDSAFASSGNTQVTQDINVNGVDTGFGGSIYIYSNSTNEFGLQVGSANSSGLLNARSGLNGGDGGTISVVNYGTGGVRVISAGWILVNPYTEGKGGNIVLGTTAGNAGPVSFNIPGTLSADGGTNLGAAGTITIAGSKFVHGTLTLSAQSVCCNGTGNISVTTTDPTSDLLIDTAVNNFQVSTNGGTVSITAGRNLTVDPAGIDASFVTLQAGYGKNAGTLTIDGSALCCDNGTVSLVANGDISIGSRIQADSISVLANNHGNITIFDSMYAAQSGLTVVASGSINGSFLNNATLQATTNLLLAAGVDASGGDIGNLQFNGSKGAINLATASPIALNSNQAYNFIRQANVYAGGNVSGSSGGSIDIKADGDINVGFVNSYGGGGSSDSGGNISINSNTGNILINGEVDASGGSGALLPGSGSGLNGGTISITAGSATGAIIINGPVISQSTSGVGSISIAANTVAFNSKVQDYFVDGLEAPYITASSPLFGQAIYASGNVDIQARLNGNGSVVTNTLYSTDGNFLSSTKPVTVSLTASSSPDYTINTGTYALANGSLGGFKSETGSVTFNGVPLGKSVSATISLNGSARILENGNAVAITDGAKVTPAELVALIQLSTTGVQSIVLNSTGGAIGGSFDITPTNIPVTGFTKLVIPSGVTANVSVPSLQIAAQGVGTVDNDGKATINGNLTFNGAFSLSAVAIDGSGSFTGSGSSSLALSTSNGSIGANAQSLFFVANNLQVTAGGAGSVVVLTDLLGGTNIQASSANSIFNVVANGSITTSGKIDSPDLRLSTQAGSGGSITISNVVGQTAGSINLNADDSIFTGPGITLTAMTLVINGSNGTVGFNGTPIMTSTANLAATAGVSVNISNQITSGAKVLNLGQSGAGDFNLVSDSGVSVNAPLTGTTVQVNANATDGLVINSTVVALDKLSLTSIGPITDSAGSSTTADKLIVSTSPSSSVSLGQTASGGGTLNVNSLQVTGGNTSILNSSALELLASTINGALDLTAPSITTTSNTSVSSGSFTTSSFNNAAIITASGQLGVQGLNGGDLELSGGGSFLAGASSALTILSANGNVLYSGNQTLTGGDVSVKAPNGAVQLDTGVVVTSNANLSYGYTGVFFGNPGMQLVNNNLPATLTAIDPNTTLGTIASPITIANPSGNIDLTGNMLIGSGGKNVAIIASGSVTGVGLKTIDLSSKTGRSGSLVILAGFNFSPVPATTPLDKTTLFSNVTPSSSGGSINLGATSIVTANLVPMGSTNRAGSVLMVANAGSSGGNPGSIYLASINSSSKLGYGGQVQLFGPGGVNVNGAINTVGTLAGGAVKVAATPASSTGTILVFNGYVSPTTKFTSTGIVNGSNAAVSIIGPITTGAINGTGAAVSISAESQVQLSKDIVTSGLTGSGVVNINSLNGAIISAGNINASGVSITNTKSPSTAGSGANILVTAPSYISIGTLSSAGGSTKGTGRGGDAGSITLSTAQNGAYFDGNIIVSSVNAAGGSAVTGKLAVAQGGAGGNISLLSGSVKVSKTVVANGVTASVISSGGGGKTVGSDGSILINTYAVQSIPANFNLSSAVMSEIALPGAIFTVGIASPVNGTAGSIASGSSIVKNGTYIVGTPLSQGGINVEAKAGANSVIDIGGSKTTVSPGTTNANRTKVTPAEAVALYQVSFGGNQTLGLTPIIGKTGGIASGMNPQTTASPSLISIPEVDLPGTGFKSFVLTAASAASAINLQISGLSPNLDISAASPRTINGQIQFTNAQSAMVNSGTAALVLPVGASIGSVGDLVLQGTSWTNAGTISAGASTKTLVLLGPGKALTFTDSSTGTLQASALSIPGNGLPTTFTFKHSSGVQNLPILLNDMFLPTGVGILAKSLMPGAAAVATSTFNLTFGGVNGQANVGGQFTSSKTALNINALTNAQKNSTDLQILPGADFNLVGKPIVLKSTGNTTFGANSSPVATINASKITATATGNLNATNLNMGSSSDITLSSTSAAVDDEGMSATAFSGLNINGKSITIGGSTSSTLTSASKGIKLIASAGAIDIKNQSTLTATSDAMLIQATGMVNLSANLTAGSTNLVATPLTDANVTKSGSITIKSGTATSPGGLNIAGGLTIQAAGTTKSAGKITFNVTGGDIAFAGNSTTLRASGGDLVLLTTGNITGAGSNEFIARGITTAVPSKTSVGGGIELGAGTSAGKLAASVGKASGTKPADGFLGGAVTYLNGTTHGVITANATANTVNLTTTGTSTIDVSKGGTVVFDTDKGKTIQLNGSNFTTESYKPISYTDEAGVETEIVLKRTAHRTPLANIVVPGASGTVVLLENGEFVGEANAEVSNPPPVEPMKNKAVGEITLVSGELLINPLKPTLIKTELGNTLIRKGGLTALSFDKDNSVLRVTACSGPGHTIVSAGKKVIIVSPGEELILSRTKLSSEEIVKEDGVGRRSIVSDKLEDGLYATRADVSIITLMANHPHLKEISHSTKNIDKKLTAKILKTAAVVGQVTNSSRGNYHSRANKSLARDVRVKSDDVLVKTANK